MIFQCQKNSFLREFTTTVKSCQEVPNCVSVPGNQRAKVYEIILEDTVLFPEGGGQPSDRGWLNDEEVLQLERREEDVVHLMKSPFTVGQTVNQKVDWELRFDRMQQHTGQHLITAVADKKFGFNTTSWSLGGSISQIELESPTGKMMTNKEMKELEETVNDHIRAALPIVVNVFDENEPPPKSVRGLPEDYIGQVRVVTISGLEDNMCCGTHLAHLGQLQAIKVLSVDRGKGRGSKSSRSFFLYFVAGDRVLSRLQESLDKESVEKESYLSTGLINSTTKTSRQQHEILFTFMEKHPDLAHSRIVGASGKAKALALWEELTSALNSCGSGPKKPIHKWQKTWSDWKSHTKKKSTKIRSQEGSEGSSPSTTTLTFLEGKLLAFLEAEEMGEDTSLPEAGIPPRETLSVSPPLETMMEEADITPTEETTKLPVIEPPPLIPSLKRRGGEEMMAGLVNVEEKRLKVDVTRRDLEYKNVEALKDIGSGIHKLAEAVERIAACFEGFLSNNKHNFEK